MGYRYFFISILITIQHHHYDQVSISALPLKYTQWMEIYEYHLEHPGLNYIQLSNDKKCGTATISRALSFMNQEVM